MLRRVNNDRAEDLAKSFCPTIYQEWKSFKDLPTSIMLDTNDNMTNNLIWAIENPSLYYLVQEDEDYIYSFYMVFHPFDWSDNKLPIIGVIWRNLDSHTFDTEGLCFRFRKLDGVLDIATIYHYGIKWKQNIGKNWVWIEDEGHGIRPWESKYQIKSKQYSVYKPDRFKLVNINQINSKQLDRLRVILNSQGVNMPEQQSDNGAIFLEPDKAFKKQFGEQ